MKDIEEIKKHKMQDTLITNWHYYDDQIVGLNIQGDFDEEEALVSDYKHYDVFFQRIQSMVNCDISKDLAGRTLRDLNIVKDGDLYKVRLVVSENESFEFGCKGVGYALKRYRGVSYRNVYGTEEYTALFEKVRYVVKPEFLVRQETYELPDGYLLEVHSYSCVESNVRRAAMDKCILRRGQEIVYEYESIYNHVSPFKEFIEHNNGHRYYPFHIDLYGISYLELDTGKVYHYVPQGYDNDWGSFYGESFIITDVHYDASTDLIAYGGCYWAGPSEVMVGNFSEPLNFNPKLFNVHELIDPEYEECNDIDFVRWEEDKLVVKVDFEKEYEIGLEEIVL